jgi:UDP-N-acetylmuramyl pentapeptide synthase
MASTGQWERVEDLVGHERDMRLRKCIDEIHQRRSSEDIDVAIVYGATHMRAVVHYLSGRYDYFASKAEWMTVLDF